MSLTLHSAISAHQTTVDINGSDELNDGDVYSIDSEYIEIRGEPFVPTFDAYQRASVYRGVQGTAKVSHAANAGLAHVLPSGGGGVTVMGAFVKTVSIPNYDQDKILFDTVAYDPLSLWNASNKQLELIDGLGGFYLVQCYIELVLSAPPTQPPEFQIDITSTPWNFDPLIFVLQEGFTPNHFIGSVEFGLPLGDPCHVYASGFWGGAATGEIVQSGLGVLRLGALA